MSFLICLCLLNYYYVSIVIPKTPVGVVPKLAQPTSTSKEVVNKGHSRNPSNGTSACFLSEWVTLNVGGRIFTTTRFVIRLM